MHPVDVATNLLEAFNAGDLGRMRELLAPDLIACGGWPTPSRPKVISSGLDEVRPSRRRYPTACDVTRG
jgi:hypothetical protein